MIPATYIYWWKNRQFFRRLLFKFREDLACFKRVQALVYSIKHLDPRVQMINPLSYVNVLTK